MLNLFWASISRILVAAFLLAKLVDIDESKCVLYNCGDIKLLIIASVELAYPVMDDSWLQYGTHLVLFLVVLRDFDLIMAEGAGEDSGKTFFTELLGYPDVKEGDTDIELAGVLAAAEAFLPFFG